MSKDLIRCKLNCEFGHPYYGFLTFLTTEIDLKNLFLIKNIKIAIESSVMPIKNDSASKGVVLFGLGILTGWVVKHLFESPEVTQKRQALMHNLADLREKLADSDEAQRVQEIFGQVTDEATEIYQDAKEELIHELSMLRLSLDEIDKQKYVEIVNDIISDIRERNGLSEKQITNFTEALMADFSKIKERRSRLKKRTRLLARRQ